MARPQNRSVESLYAPSTTISNNLMPNKNITDHMSRQHTVINNVYELPRRRKIIRFYHASAGLLKKAMWIKVIRAEFFVTWRRLPQNNQILQNAVAKIHQTVSMFKDHFKALVGVDITFPLHLWHSLLLQAQITLNILQPTNIAPKISAYAYICRQHNFHKMLLAPMSCAVLLHREPDIRKTWDYHAINGLYIYDEIRKGMYSSPQVGLLAHKLFEE